MEKFVDCRVQTSAKEAVARSEQTFVGVGCLSSGSAQAYCAHAGDERHAARSLERPHGPPTEDGDYAAGALGVHWLRPQCLKPHTVQTSYTVRPLCPGLRDGREAKVRPAALQTASGAGTYHLSHRYHLSIDLTIYITYLTMYRPN